MRILLITGLLLICPILVIAQVTYHTDGKNTLRCEVVQPVDIEAQKVKEADLSAQISKLEVAVVAKKAELETLKTPIVIKEEEPIGIGTVEKGGNGGVLEGGNL